MDNRALEDGPPCPEAPGWARRESATHLLEGFGGVVVVGDMMDQLAVKLIKRAEEPVAQPHGTLDDGVEDRLHVIVRLADDPENVAGRCLLLPQFADLRLGLSQSGRDLCIQRRWRATRTDRLKRGRALLAELCGRAILVLAPGTLHAGPPWWVGPVAVGTVR